MKRLYWYHGAFAVLGLSFLLNAAASFVAGDQGVVPLVVAVSGAGLFLRSGYESLRSDPAEFTLSAGAILVISGAAALSLVLTLLEIALSA